MRSPRRDIGYRRDAHESTRKHWKTLKNKGFHSRIVSVASAVRINNQRQSIALDNAMNGKTKSRSAQSRPAGSSTTFPVRRGLGTSAGTRYLIVTFT
jgi:hypothetical protein